MFSTTTEHALRALTQLADLPEHSSMLGRDLAVAAEIPANYLSKILVSLRNAGLIAAVRGSGGGYRLRRPAAEICLLDVVGIFEGRERVSRCLLGGGRACADENPCSAHARWRSVRQEFDHFLASTSIAQISLDGGKSEGSTSSGARSRRKGGRP